MLGSSLGCDQAGTRETSTATKPMAGPGRAHEAMLEPTLTLVWGQGRGVSPEPELVCDQIRMACTSKPNRPLHIEDFLSLSLMFCFLLQKRWCLLTPYTHPGWKKHQAN